MYEMRNYFAPARLFGRVFFGMPFYPHPGSKSRLTLPR